MTPQSQPLGKIQPLVAVSVNTALPKPRQNSSAWDNQISSKIQKLKTKAGGRGGVLRVLCQAASDCHANLYVHIRMTARSKTSRTAMRMAIHHPDLRSV
jgi:hypothetical protein